MESIIGKCLVHTDIYVRRNAVACLAKIHEYYGDEFMPDIVDRLEESLDKENDLTTKRNIFLLFFRLDRDRALNFIIEKIKEEDHETFGDILQLMVIKMVQEALVKDRKVAGTCMRIIREFSSSKFNSVLYEVACAMIRYSKSSEVLRSALSILLQVLKNNNDNNVKLLILDQLEIIRKKDKLVIMDYFVDLVTLLFSGDLEIKLKFISFMEIYIKKDNIGVIQKTLIEEFKKCLADKNTDKEYQTKIILLINKLVPAGVISTKTFLTQILPIILHNSALEQSTFDVVRLTVKNIFEKFDAKEKESFLEVLKNQLQEIKEIKVCSMVVNMLGLHLSKVEQAQEVLGSLMEAVGDLPLKQKAVKVEVKTEEQQAEKKFTRKTVIKEDGTYGEELVEVTDETEVRYLLNRLKKTNKKSCTTKLEIFVWNLKTSA